MHLLLFSPLPLPRQGVLFLLRSIAHQLSGRNPFTQSLTGCAAILTPARATCGRDKRPGRVRKSGGALAVEDAGHQ
jgi:hypothetical protein